MNKERFLAFTDAIMAIIVTIMVLELRLPDRITLESLRELVVPMFAYIISFVMIYASWMSHHQIFKNVKEVPLETFWINGAWLFFMSLFPMATRAVGSDIYSHSAELIYLVVTFLWVSMSSLMRRSLVRLLPDTVIPQKTHTAANWIYLTVIAVSMLLSLIWAPLGIIGMLVITTYNIAVGIYELYRSRVHAN